MNEEVKTEIVVDELEPAVKPAAIESEPAPAEPAAPAKAEQPKPKAAPKLQEPAASHVVSGNETDNVLLSSCVYENMYACKSLTVHHLQRRLVELGHSAAGLDKDGYYGDLTRVAVAEFQAKEGFESTGVVDGPTMEAVFKGDPNVKVHV